MARVSEHYTKDKVLDILRFLIVVHTLQPNTYNVQGLESQGQAFIQTDKHLTYIVGDYNNGIPLEIKPGHSNQEFSQHDENFYSVRSVRLDPQLLDFSEQPVGMPRMEKVTVQNIDSKNMLHLVSISGSTVHFHCSFFQDKVVPPGGNTTFDVVFLARQVGNVENTLYIRTSLGYLKYQVFGVGVPNPYRLRPYLGARVPVNSTFSPLIEMHNPHNTKLQVLEMFSSEGDLHLELPSGEKEAGKELWEIQPFETKSVMRANFIARIENNHTAFIRIKTSEESQSKLLILPIEVEVSSEPGIYSPVEMIDFGILRTFDEPKSIKLSLLNTGSNPIHINSIVVSPPNDAISIDFRPTKIPSDSHKQTTVAHITYKAAKALHQRQWSGKIIIKSKNNLHKLILPYQANVLHGSMVYNVNMTYFFSLKILRNVSRPLAFTNTFNFSVVIYNVSLPPQAATYFSILNFTSPLIILPQQTVVPFIIMFHPNATQLHFNTVLTLHTNTSTFQVPLIVYNGLFKVIHHRPEKFKGQLDFGTMGVGESRSMTFTVRNDNPVDVIIDEYKSNMKQTKIGILGIEKGNGTTLTRIHNQSEIDTDPLTIKPYHYAVFSVDVIAPSEEGAYAAEVMIVTQFQDLFIPMTLRTAEGSLNAIPDKFVFDRVYPGKTPFKVLQINSTFKDYMEVTQVTFNPADTRFYFIPENDNVVILKPGEPNVVGKIFFDAKKECLEDCYVGLPTFTPGGNQWLVGLNLEKEVVNTDQYLFTWLQQKWEKLENSEHKIANVTIELDTNHVRGFLFSAQACLHWPSLVRKTLVKFPLTQIGNISISDVIIENPGDHPVLVQILPLSLYPSPHTVIDLIGQRLSGLTSEYIETEESDTFTLRDLEYYNKGETMWTNHRKRVENVLGPKPHEDSLAALLQPGQKVKVKIGFQPRDDVLRTSLIVIRNNLTIIDAVVVQGQGRRGDLKFSGRRPGYDDPLLFDMTEKHLKNCDISEKKSTKSLVPHFTVRRTWTLRNTGELPFYVRGFSINNSPCEGFGFKVFDCDGFEMLPNTSRKIDIAFTPDFTMSRIRRRLTIFTSLGPPANYTLQATVPPHLLPKCSAALPRPNWEPVLYYSIVCVMSFLLFCIMVAVYFEADRIIVADILRRKLKVNNGQIFDKGKVFDLNSIAGLSPLIQKPQPQQSPVIEVKQPTSSRILDMNGHVDYRRANRESLFTSILSVLRNLIPQKIFRPNSRKIDRQASREKEVKSNSVQSNGKPQTNDKDKHHQHSNATENNVTDKNSQSQKVRKVKVAKKHQENSSTDVSVPANEKKKEHERKVESDVSVKNIDNIEFLADLIEKEDTTLTKTNNTKSRNKKKRGKGNDILNSIRLKDTSVLPDDKDETSSTTTDSSNGDNEEKNSSARDSTPEPVISSTKTKKHKIRPSERTPVSYIDDYSGEGEFQLRSKSKAHRKVRVNPNETFGGNILRPSSLELPYSMESKSTKEEKPEETRIKRTTKTSKKVKGAAVVVATETDSEDPGRDSPPPSWDQPNLTPGDLSDLSIQTQDFAAKHIKSFGGNGAVNGFSPDSLTSSSRSSSYSSIVSNSSNGTDAKAKPRVDKRFPNNFNPFADNGLPVIKPNVSSAAPEKGSNPWANPPSTSSAIPIVDNMGVNSFGLHTIDENTSTNYLGAAPSNPGSFPSNDFGYNMNGVIGSGLYPGFNSLDSHQQSQHLTMMQQLQAERRRRFQEHQMKMLHQGQGWPGFDVPPVRSESLWDSPLDTNSWSVATDSPPNPNSGGFWNTLTNSATSGWNSFASIWGNTPSTSAPPTLPTETSLKNDMAHVSPSVPMSTANDVAGNFHPFGPVQDIWSPGSNNNGSTSWDKFSPTQEKDENKN